MPDYRRNRGIGAKGGNLTPAEAQRSLAAPVWAVLTGRAQAQYPNSSYASCSGLVYLVATGIGCANGPLPVPGLPVCLNWKQYDSAVVPVLLDERWQAPVFQLLDPRQAIPMLGEVLAQSFHDAGYGPLP
jgi:hypothetical protein